MSQTENLPKKGRTLVICFDGTADEYDATNTNVVKFYGLLTKDRPDEQLCYYQPGVGTYFNPGVVSPLLTWLAKILDMAVAWYLDAHVLGGYQFLMENYREGDRICIFGFSRGAYIARALAGVLHKVGLLSKDNVEQVPFAYKLYKRQDASGIALAAGFKQTFSRNVKIEFVGVWDTVASVGAVISRSLPFTYSNKAIKTFRHALSLDEHRAKFQPDLYHRPAPDAKSASKDPQHSSTIQGVSSGIQHAPQPGTISRVLKGSPKSYKAVDGTEDGEDVDVLEVWFSGCHEDVGGGAVPDTTIHNLAHSSLRWMVQEVIKSQCGVLFDELALEREVIAVPPLGQDVPPPWGDCNSVDSLQPNHDDLTMHPLWWILEFLPFSYAFQDPSGVWHQCYRINFGRGRVIPDSKPLFHVTVKERMESPLKYTPKAQWVHGSEIYVD